jgi:hypothetical protein
MLVRCRFLQRVFSLRLTSSFCTGKFLMSSFGAILRILFIFMICHYSSTYIVTRASKNVSLLITAVPHNGISLAARTTSYIILHVPFHYQSSDSPSEYLICILLSSSIAKSATISPPVIESEEHTPGCNEQQ